MKPIRLPALLIALVVTFSLLFCGCSSRDPVAPEDPGPGSDNLSTGDSVPVLTHTFGTGGGTETVVAPGHPVDGLEITIPEDAFDSPVRLEISYAPVTAHEYGEDFTPISPLITIDAEGVVADGALTLKIPASVSPDHFAMPFFYDPVDGSLGPMTVVEIGEDYIVGMTRSFSSLVVSEIDLARIYGSSTISSGFLPTKDGWQYPNEGTVYSPAGLCAGMSVSSVWYYMEAGPPSLYGEFDQDMLDSDTPNFWRDDVDALRWGSIVQEDPDTWKNYEMYAALFDDPVDRITWESLVYAMMWGDPQLLCVHSTTGGDGHAIVAYAVDLQQHRVLVYDPNFPGVAKYIQYDPGTEKFEPYNSKLKATDSDLLFDKIVLYFVKKLCDMDKLDGYWTETSLGTIGDSEFADFEITMFSDVGDSARLVVASASDPEQINIAKSETNTFRVTYPNPAFNAKLKLYEYDPLFTTVRALPSDAATFLADENFIGVEVLVDSASVPGEDWVWAGFEWYAVHLGPHIQSIVPVFGRPGDTVTIQGTQFGGEGNKYVWFGDQAGDIVSWTDTQVEAVIPEGVSGEVPVRVQVGFAESNAFSITVGDELLAVLQATQFISISVSGDHRVGDDPLRFSGFSPSMSEVTWNGTSFTATVQEEWGTGDGGEGTSTETITGTVDIGQNRSMSLTYSYSSRFEAPATEYTGARLFTIDTSIAIENLDFREIRYDLAEFRENGPEVGNLVSLAHREYTDIGDGYPGEAQYTHTDWYSTDVDPYIVVNFRP